MYKFNSVNSAKTFFLLGGIGVVTGLVNGLLGIGGGTILIPAMVFFLGEEQHVAHGTSLAIILPTAFVSAYVYQSYGHMNWSLVFQVAVGGVIGGYLGAKLMEKIPALRLKQLFGLFMILAGARMVF